MFNTVYQTHEQVTVLAYHLILADGEIQHLDLPISNGFPVKIEKLHRSNRFKLKINTRN